MLKKKTNSLDSTNNELKSGSHSNSSGGGGFLSRSSKSPSPLIKSSVATSPDEDDDNFMSGEEPIDPTNNDLQQIPQEIGDDDESIAFSGNIILQGWLKKKVTNRVFPVEF
jgi:hypothetical protein